MAKKSLNSKHRLFFGCLVFLSGIPIAKGDYLRDGRDAFMRYDFELASELYEKYAKILKKTPDEHGEELLDKYLRQLEIAENSLDNVQKIEIIDRLDVPKTDFFKAIKLPVSGGKLLPSDIDLPGKERNVSDFTYSTEAGDLMMWSVMDGNQEVIMQSERLMDGSWEAAEKTGEILNDGGNARNPFLLSDGLTLYYVSDGEESMGGYDLFVATKDAVSGEYRQPIGLGYPFNSPFNEYMMAIDEDNGIGWWVTDRNGLDGQVSVYVFKTNDVRKNYVPEEEDDIISLAMAKDYQQTQNPDTDYAALIKGIEERNGIVLKGSDSDFIFPLPGGKIARSMFDFSNTAAKRAMQKYMQADKELSDMERKLADLRVKYHESGRSNNPSRTLRDQILELENNREKQLNLLKQLRNTVISEEIKR